MSFEIDLACNINLYENLGYTGSLGLVVLVYAGVR